MRVFGAVASGKHFRIGYGRRCGPWLGCYDGEVKLRAE
jgi:hypothetical protein